MPVDLRADCARFAEAVSGSLDAHGPMPPDVAEHVSVCLRCQADLVQYRKVLRLLRSLRSEVLEPAPGLLPDILARLGEEGERHAILSVLHGRRAAYLGGIAAAATAAGAGALVIAGRRSRTKLVG